MTFIPSNFRRFRPFVSFYLESLLTFYLLFFSIVCLPSNKSQGASVISLSTSCSIWLFVVPFSLSTISTFRSIWSFVLFKICPVLLFASFNLLPLSILCPFHPFVSLNHLFLVTFCLLRLSIFFDLLPRSTYGLFGLFVPSNLLSLLAFCHFKPFVPFDILSLLYLPIVVPSTFHPFRLIPYVYLASILAFYILFLPNVCPFPFPSIFYPFQYFVLLHFSPLLTFYHFRLYVPFSF